MIYITKKITLIVATTIVAAVLAVHFIPAIFVKMDKAVQLKTFKTDTGWGYSIDVNNKTYIYQPFIPVITTKKSFPSKAMAENVGRIVMNKLIEHQTPIVTKNDLINAGVPSEILIGIPQ